MINQWILKLTLHSDMEWNTKDWLLRCCRFRN